MSEQVPGEEHIQGDLPWGPPTDDEELTLAFASLADTARSLMAVLSGVRPTAEMVRAADADLRGVISRLQPAITTEERQLAGRGFGIPGRSQLLVPVVVLDESSSAGELAGTVEFSRYYLGGHGAAHGGSLPLAFDELLGRAAAGVGDGRSRTAYLHVNYRSVTPLETPLRITAHVDRIEGRKIFVTGELRDGERLCADAEALFVTLRPGQP